jgi:hypothetical protein
MKWSRRICRIAGIDIYLHMTFIMLLAWIALGHFAERHNLLDAINGVMFVVVIFSIIVMHELGHALTALT